MAHRLGRAGAPRADRAQRRRVAPVLLRIGELRREEHRDAGDAPGAVPPGADARLPVRGRGCGAGLCEGDGGSVCDDGGEVVGRCGVSGALGGGGCFFFVFSSLHSLNMTSGVSLCQFTCRDAAFFCVSHAPKYEEENQ